MNVPPILLVLFILPSGDDDTLLRVLRERGEVIATRIPAATGPFLGECLSHLRREDLSDKRRRELAAIAIRALGSWKADARDDLVESLSGDDLAILKDLLGEKEEPEPPPPDPVTLEFPEALEFPALDAYEARWPDRVRRVDREGPRSFIPFPDMAGYEVEVPLEGGTTGTVVITGDPGKEVVLPDRFVEGMVLVVPEGIPFFIDREECPVSRIVRFLEDRPDEMGWLAEQVSGALDLSEADRPVRLREDRTSLEVWRAITNYAAFWEGKGILREEEWRIVARPWLVVSGRRIQRWIGRGEMEATGSGKGPFGLHHVLGNAWEAVEGRRVVGGGAEGVPWELDRELDQILERSFPWGEASVRGIGFRMVLRLQSREGD